MDALSIILILLIGLAPIAYFAYFKKKIKDIVSVNSNKGFLIFIILSIYGLLNLFTALFDCIGIETHYSFLLILEAILVLAGLSLALVSFR